MNELRDKIAGLLSTIDFQPSTMHPEAMNRFADEVLILMEGLYRIEYMEDPEAEGACICCNEDGIKYVPIGG